MCVIDDAAKQNELIAANELAYRKPVLKAVGACWFCHEPLPVGRTFCHNAKGSDRGCEDDYNNRQLAKKRNGQ